MHPKAKRTKSVRCASKSKTYHADGVSACASKSKMYQERTLCIQKQNVPDGVSACALHGFAITAIDTVDQKWMQ